MQPSMMFTILASAACAMGAAVAHDGYKPKPSPTPAPVNQCQAGTSESCCKGGLLGLNCNVIVAGAVCDGTVACCSTNQSGLINVDLSCLALTL